MASRSATVLVIFVIAIIAFCLASVFGAMTGPISILPNENETSGGVLDNLSAITDGTGDTGISYGNENYDHSSSSSPNVETTQDNSEQSSDSNNNNVETTQDNSEQSSDSDSNSNNGGDANSNNNNPNVETTTGTG